MARLYQWIRRGFGFLLQQLMCGFAIARRQIGGGRVFIKRGAVYYIPLWLPIVIGLALGLAVIAGNLAERFLWPAARPAAGELADFFAPSVHYWSGKISEWAAAHEVDPHLLATVMQIESCGHPKAVSSAGARGLFQVMPLHFEDSEDMLDPDTNAMRGGSFLNYCYQAAGGVIGLTLACYNGGPAAISQPARNWPAETQRYHRWGVGIYSDAIANRAESDIFHQWLRAGGSRLCDSAVDELQRHPPLSASS